MAKVGFWLKGSTGKMAGATMYKDGASGDTVIREIVTPSNPKTTAQNVQRIIMLTVGQAYSLVKEICDHSFEGVKAGRDTMAYFMKQNIQFCREKLAQMQAEGVDYGEMYNFLPLGMKGFVPNQYQISMGSLPRIECTLYDDANTKAFVGGIPANATYADVINALGLQRGDQLTFMYMRGSASFANDINFQFARVILDPTNEDYSQASLETPFLNGNKINKPSVRNEGDFSFVISAHGLGFEGKNTTVGLINPCIAACVIVSRKVGDSWNRSTAYLTYLPNYNAYSMGDCLQRAANGVSAPLYTPNPHYLNNAGEGNSEAVEAGGTTPGQGGESGGGGTTGEASIASLSVDGSPAIAGTQKTITKEQDTTFPTSVPVVASGENLTGLFLVIKNGNTEVASVGFSNGSATANVSAEKDVVYSVEVQNEDSERVLATGYTFMITAMNED